MRDRLGRPPALLMVPAALAALLLLVPLVAMVASTSWAQLPEHLTSRVALDALRLSLVTSTVAIAFCLLLGLPLAWLLAQKLWIVPIPGTTKLHRLEENIGATAIELTPDDLHAIESAASKITVQGARYTEDMERMTGR